MDEGMDVDVGALAGLGSSLSSGADALGALDPAPPLAESSTAMPGSDVAAALGALTTDLVTAWRGVGDRVRTMSTSATSAAADYAAVDEANGDGFAHLECGH